MRGGRGDEPVPAPAGAAWHPRALAAAALALVALSALLMAGPALLPPFWCRSFDGPPSLALGPHPMVVRPVACALGGVLGPIGLGLAGSAVALGWAVARRSPAVAAVAGAVVLGGVAWLFFAVGGPSLVERALRHLRAPW